MLGCLAGILLAICAHLIDDNDLFGDTTLPGEVLIIGKDTVRSLLSTIAGATATMMSLTYTLTLLIFTLAAGQLGPRLLDSFYDNRMNQVAIAIMSATFVFMLVAIFLLTEGQGASVTGIIAIMLAVLSVGTLIYFVHDVAQRVLVDNEIALTAKRLRATIAGAFRERDNATQPVEAMPDRDAGPARIIHCSDTGYLRSIDIDELVQYLAKTDGTVEILVAPGEYLIQRMPVAIVRRAGSVEDWEKTINERLVLGRSRSSEGDLLFLVNLLVEIALRALSPGVNDSFTAVSAIDHLSGAFGDMLQRIPASPLYQDEDGVVRVMASVLTVDQILDTALNPIRRNAAGNMLVSCTIIDAIRRMIEVSDAEYIPLLRHHADLVGRTALPADAAEEDRQHLATRLLTVLPDGATPA